MDHAIPLIGEAWDHRRRRRRRVLAASGALLALAAALVLMLETSPAARRPAASRGSATGPGLRVPAGARAVLPAAVFSQAPYMGVRCPVPNSIACDRVGLAIWLKRPAVSAEASIAGATRPLNWFGDEHRIPSPGKPRRAFTGYLHPAQIVSRLHVQPVGRSMWYGDGNPLPLVKVLVDYGHGRLVVTQLRVPLNAGWG